MGKFTVRDDPQLDRTIENHMVRIIDAVRSKMEPVAILLRGSFGRGEGSVAIIDGGYQFYSDYEIDVATYSPGYRSLFKDLSRQLTEAFKVETSLRWIRPDFLEKHRTGPFVTGKEPVSISTYESRYGSLVLFGDEFISRAAAIDPREIEKVSGIYLVLNRMAESMLNMENARENRNRNQDSVYWYNKTILACSEALLLNWEQYHYSYAERGRRFEALADQKLNFMGDLGEPFARLVSRATQYKLAPDAMLYPHSSDELWDAAIPMIDKVYQYLAAQVMQIEPWEYESFPGKYLAYTAERSRRKWLTAAGEKMLEFYRSLRAHHLAPGLFTERDLSEIVYANVPLIFHSLGNRECASVLQSAHRSMKPLGEINSPKGEAESEPEYLRRKVTWMWKVYCYG